MMTLTNPASANVVTFVARPWRQSSVRCSSSSVTNSQKLRSELDQLHSEADVARTKANSARLRLMRLSETAEKLRQQAAISVQAGKENYARDLLLQKKKIMQAMEKSKKRIELLDELCAKLNQAISTKESQLIGNVTLELEVEQEAAPTPICIAPAESEKETTSVVDTYVNIGEDRNLEVDSELQKNGATYIQSQIVDTKSILDGNGIVDKLRDISSYEEFLEHLDGQLSIIEAELAILIRLSGLVMEREEMPLNTKVHQTLAILEGIRSVRERIKDASQTYNASDYFLPN